MIHASDIQTAHKEAGIEERNRVIKYLDTQLSTAIQLGITPTYNLLDGIIRDIKNGKHWGDEWK